MTVGYGRGGEREGEEEENLIEFYPEIFITPEMSTSVSSSECDPQQSQTQQLYSENEWKKAERSWLFARRCFQIGQILYSQITKREFL